MQSIQVLVLDPQRAVGAALAAALSAEPDLNVVDVTDSAQAVLSPASPEFDVLLLDLGAVGYSGLDLVRRSRQQPGDRRAVVVSDATDPSLAIAAAHAGVSAWVPKRLGLSHLVRVVRGVSAGESWFPPELLGPILADLVGGPSPSSTQSKINKLTRREQEILSCLGNALDRRTIARQLYLSANTVRTHIQNILGKLDVHSELEAAAIWLRCGKSATALASPTYTLA